MIKIDKETRDYVIVTDSGLNGYHPVTQKQQKLLCIGGPFNGQKMATAHFQITGTTRSAGYLQYNRATRRFGVAQAVYIHDSVLIQ